MQTDPIGYADQMNLYGYVYNDPMNYTDPYGLSGDPTCGSDATSCHTFEQPIPDNDLGGPDVDLTGEAAQQYASDVQNAQERTWGSYLPGTKAGESAQGYWAGQVVNAGGGFTDAPLAFTGLVFASMWTDETAVEVAFTLGTAGGGGALFGWLPKTLGSSKIGHRFFTASRKNGTWNTGKFRFGWSGTNGSDTYQLMFRYKQTHVPTGVKTTRSHPSGG